MPTIVSVEAPRPWSGIRGRSTVPAAPSTRTRVPSPMRRVPSTVPTTAGIPISRDTMAACDTKLPWSVTIAPTRCSIELNASPVVGATSTSPGSSRRRSSTEWTSLAVPSYVPAAPGIPPTLEAVPIGSSSCPRTPSIANPTAPMTRAIGGGQHLERRRVRWRWTEVAGRALDRETSPGVTALRQLVGGGRRRIHWRFHGLR